MVQQNEEQPQYEDKVSRVVSWISCLGDELNRSVSQMANNRPKCDSKAVRATSELREEEETEVLEVQGKKLNLKLRGFRQIVSCGKPGEEYYTSEIGASLNNGPGQKDRIAIRILQNGAAALRASNRGSLKWSIPSLIVSFLTLLVVFMADEEDKTTGAMQMSAIWGRLV